MKKSTAVFGVLVLAVLAGAFVFVLPSFTKSFNEEFKKRVDQGFRAKFMPVCLGAAPTDNQKAVCECAAKETLARLTLKQLTDQEFVKYYIKRSILPGCVEAQLPK